MKYFYWVTLFMLLNGCAQKYLVLEAQVVSMTRSDSSSATELKIGEEIEERWCVDEGVVFGSEEGEIGMADQVIHKAQQGGKRAHFITNVRVFRDSTKCASLTGRIAHAKLNEPQ